MMIDKDGRPTYALRSSDIWSDYDQRIADDQLAAFFSTYWCDLGDLDVTTDRLNAEFVRYATGNAQQRPGAVYSGVLRIDGQRTGPLEDTYETLIDSARTAKETPAVSYSEGDISAVETRAIDGDDAACVAVTEAGCAGYFDDTCTLLEQRGGAVIRTSVKPGSQDKHMTEMYASGFQAVVRQRVVDGPTPEWGTEQE